MSNGCEMPSRRLSFATGASAERALCRKTAAKRTRPSPKAQGQHWSVDALPIETPASSAGSIQSPWCFPARTVLLQLENRFEAMAGCRRLPIRDGEIHASTAGAASEKVATARAPAAPVGHRSRGCHVTHLLLSRCSPALRQPASVLHFVASIGPTESG